MNIRETLAKRLNQIQIMLETPGAFAARRAGCYFELFQMVSRLHSMGLRPKTILDIGANRGMFTRCAHYVFPEASIHAFEPLDDCYAELCKLKNSMKNLECYNIAIGDSNREDVIHRSNYDYSSSLLEIEKLHLDAFPYSKGTTLQKIRIRTLDGLKESMVLQSPTLLKIDVQGFETQVLQGAKNILRDIDYIIVEMSLRKLYKDQGLFDEVYTILIKNGFEFRGPLAQLDNPETKEVLQIDALFIKSKIIQ
jgi:FkbM family methyltransferase